MYIFFEVWMSEQLNMWRSVMDQSCVCIAVILGVVVWEGEIKLNVRPNVWINESSESFMESIRKIDPAKLYIRLDQDWSIRFFCRFFISIWECFLLSTEL